MVEQLGSIWVEITDGVYVPSIGADAICRHPTTLEVLSDGEIGLIQVFSNIPRSYPGHSVLTDDVGAIIVNEIDVETFGSKGLKIVGRIPKSEPRGCSDAVAN